MTSQKEKITFAVDGENFGNFKLREGDRRMKLYIKLNKEETQQWEALSTAYRPFLFGVPRHTQPNQLS